MMGTKQPVSYVLGLAFLAIGLIPILKNFGTIGFTIPPLEGIVLQIVMIIGGVWLLVDAISMMTGGMASFGPAQYFMFGSFIVGMAALALGLIPILHGMGTIGFTIPALGETILNIIYVVIGCLLILDGSQIMF